MFASQAYPAAQSKYYLLNSLGFDFKLVDVLRSVDKLRFYSGFVCASHEFSVSFVRVLCFELSSVQTPIEHAARGKQHRACFTFEKNAFVVPHSQIHA